MYTYIFIHLYIFIYIIQEPPHLKLISFFSPILVQEYWCGTEAAWNIMDAVIIVVSLVETGIDIWAQAGRWLGLEELGAFQTISTIIGIKSQGDLSIPKCSRNYHQIYHYIIDIICK